MNKIVSVGGYDQKITFAQEDGQIYIKDATCTCRWGSINPQYYQKGEKICWHLTSAIKTIARVVLKKKVSNGV